MGFLTYVETLCSQTSKSCKFGLQGFNDRASDGTRNVHCSGQEGFLNIPVLEDINLQQFCFNDRHTFFCQMPLFPNKRAAQCAWFWIMGGNSSNVTRMWLRTFSLWANATLEECMNTFIQNKIHNNSFLFDAVHQFILSTVWFNQVKLLKNPFYN